ncbi:di-trans,poly-cis-decaprenylcistransferase [Candidatus Microgenomates bacterium]|nr:di-trans,poly-cis-decaprenylcistransferase [Candidatus Microgenomates bacterium]
MATLLRMQPERLRNDRLLDEGREIVRRTKLQHVAFIVDGNRRWAQKEGLPVLAGHRRALEVVMERVEDGVAMGIPVMSFWLFSTENWRRSREQIEGIFGLGREMKDRVRETLTRLQVRFETIGRSDRLPEDLVGIISELKEETRDNTTMTVVAAIDYGGRDEIMRATNKAIDGGSQLGREEEYNRLLDTAGFPDPDFVIRTSGERRTSGFMPWQTAYSEWYFPQTFFTGFGQEELVIALRDFSQRQRRFGGG